MNTSLDFFLTACFFLLIQHNCVILLYMKGFVVKSFGIFSILVAIAGALCIGMSTIWQQESVIRNTAVWKKVSTGWTIREPGIVQNKSVDSRGISISRNFSVDEVNQLMKAQTITSMETNDIVYAAQPNPNLCFMTHNQAVTIFVNWGEGENLIYSSGLNGRRVFGSENGTQIHSVLLPYAGQKDILVTVNLMKSFDESTPVAKFFGKFISKNEPPVFFLCDAHLITGNYIIISIFQIIPIFLIFIAGLFSVVFWFVFKIMRHAQAGEYLYWGLVSIVCASGFMCESVLGIMIAKNSFLPFFISTIALASLPRLFIKYMLEKKIFQYDEKIALFFRGIPKFNFIIVTVAALIPWLPFSLVRVYITAILVIFLIFIDYTIIRELVSSGRKITAYDLTLLGMTFSVYCDVIYDMFQNPMVDCFFFSRVGVMVFLIVSTIVSFNDFLNKQELDTRSNMLKEASYRDIYTGVKNGAALWKDARKNNFEEKGFSCVVFKIMNVRKFIEDSGYRGVDNAIGGLVRMAKEIFDTDDIYRIKGNQILVVTTKSNAEDLILMNEKIIELLEPYTTENSREKIKVRWGGKYFSPVEDKDVESLNDSFFRFRNYDL